MAFTHLKALDCVCDQCGDSQPFEANDTEVTWDEIEAVAIRAGWKLVPKTLCKDCKPAPKRKPYRG